MSSKEIDNIQYKAHILLVDDGKVNRILGKKILT
jgi:hypothetical protein